MNKSFLSGIIILLCLIFNSSCTDLSNKDNEVSNKKVDAQQLLALKNGNDSTMPVLPFYFTVQPAVLNCRIPALQSFAFGQYNGLWIFIGGEKKGFHGTSNDPPPFQSTGANDSIWVIDINQQQSWSVAVPSSLSTILCATNSAYYQVGDLLYLCGGFTRDNSSASSFNYTSNNLLEIDLSALVSYVQSNGNSMPFSNVITKQIQSPYVQVTGGALVYSNSYFYLIGGQNYNTAYSSGTTGIYTNAIRRFSLQQQQGMWVIGDTASIIDPINLHRRDMNVVPGPTGANEGVVLYGGVFTKQDEAFRNAIFINGLSTGNPSIVADTIEQDVNQYTCAVASFGNSSFPMAITTFFGGITYKMFDEQSKSLVVGDNGIPMPFSNIVSTIITGGGINNSIEFIQLPPAAPLLPGFIGANAVFIPNPQFTSSVAPSQLDLNKINADTTTQFLAGYIFGGIVSRGPTSGTTAKGFVPTFANPVVYNVYFNYPGLH